MHVEWIPMHYSMYVCMYVYMHVYTVCTVPLLSYTVGVPMHAGVPMHVLAIPLCISVRHFSPFFAPSIYK